MMFRILLLLTLLIPWVSGGFDLVAEEAVADAKSIEVVRACCGPSIPPCILAGNCSSLSSPWASEAPAVVAEEAKTVELARACCGPSIPPCILAGNCSS